MWPFPGPHSFWLKTSCPVSRARTYYLLQQLTTGLFHCCGTLVTAELGKQISQYYPISMRNNLYLLEQLVQRRLLFQKGSVSISLPCGLPYLSWDDVSSFKSPRNFGQMQGRNVCHLSSVSHPPPKKHSTKVCQCCPPGFDLMWLEHAKKTLSDEKPVGAFIRKYCAEVLETPQWTFTLAKAFLKSQILQTPSLPCLNGYVGDEDGRRLEGKCGLCNVLLHHPFPFLKHS